MKTCTKCGAEYPATREYFPPHKRTRDGLSSWCRPCARACSRRYQRANREARRAYMRQWREANPEYMRQWYEENREAQRVYKRQYRTTKPEVHRAAWHRRRARKLEAPGDGVSAGQWADVLERYGHKCLACGATEDLTMDHVVPLAKGGAHDVSNVQPLCHSCNASKQDQTIDYRPDVSVWPSQRRGF